MESRVESREISVTNPSVGYMPDANLVPLRYLVLGLLIPVCLLIYCHVGSVSVST